MSPFKMSKVFLHHAQVAKFRQIWSHYQSRTIREDFAVRRPFEAGPYADGRVAAVAVADVAAAAKHG